MNTVHTKSFGENEGTSFVIGKFSVMTTKHLDFEAWRGVVWQATALLQPPVPSLSLFLRPSLSHLPVHVQRVLSARLLSCSGPLAGRWIQ